MTRILAVALLALTVVMPATAGTARHFSGRTAGDMPIVFRVSADGRRLDHLALGYLAFCDDDVAFARADTHAAPVPVARDGTFVVHIDRAASHVAIRGRISGRRASGTVHVRVGLGDGQADCVTPGVPWTARA